MIIILINWIYLFFVTYFCGRLGLHYLNKFINVNSNELIFNIESLSLISIFGLSLISFLNIILHFFIPIGININLIIILLSTISCFKMKLKFDDFKIINLKSSIYYYLLFGIILLLTIVWHSISTSNYDEGLYYIQNIRWAENYPFVKGLANLHSRLGVNSSWYHLCTVFNWSFLGVNGLNDLNGFLIILLSISVIYSFKKIIANKFYFEDIFILIFFIFLFKYYLGFNSNNPSNTYSLDFGVVVLIGLLCFFYLKEIRINNSNQINATIFVMVAILVFMFTVRFSNILLFCIIIIFLFYKINYTKKNLILLSVILSIGLIPYFISNYIVSGYLIFPLYQIDVFNPLWKVPVLRQDSSLNPYWVISAFENQSVVKSWARIPFRDFKEVLNMSDFEWINVWFNNKNNTQKEIVYFIFAMIGVLPFVTAIKNFKNEFIFSRLLCLIVTLNFCLVFWLFSAPDDRFIYGVVFSGISILIAVILINLFEISKYVRFAAILFWCLMVLKYSYKNINYFIKNETLTLSLFFPPKHKIQITNSQSLNGFEMFYLSENTDQCWDSKLPCTPYPQSKLTLIDGSLENGFYITK